MKSSEVKQKFVEMRASGLSYQTIATDLGVSKQTLINWSRELNEDLANYSAIERDHLMRQYQLVKDARVKRLGELLSRLEAEFATRSLSRLPTDKVFEMLLKVNVLLEKEMETTVFCKKNEVIELDLSSKSTWVG